MAFYAYIYSDPITYEQFYVGRGHGERAQAHMSPKGSHNKGVKSRITKLKLEGLKPIITIIETSTTQFASMLEVGLVKQFGRRSHGTGTLYNLTDGGEDSTGRVRTEEQKRKTSESLKKFYATHKCVKTQESIDKMKATKAKHPTGTGKWMNNGERQTKVELQYVKKFLDDGWVLGQFRNFCNDEYREKLRIAAKKQWAIFKSTGNTSNLIKIKD